MNKKKLFGIVFGFVKNLSLVFRLLIAVASVWVINYFSHPSLFANILILLCAVSFMIVPFLAIVENEFM